MTPKKRRRIREQKSKEQGRLCYWCGKRMKQVTLDHVISRRIGGEDVEENCVAACGACNGLKADRTPEEFIRRRLLDMQKFLESEGFKRYGRRH